MRAQVHNRQMLVFAGDNGLTSDGLMAVSTELLVSIINSHGTRLRLIVLNGCKTFDVLPSISCSRRANARNCWPI